MKKNAKSCVLRAGAAMLLLSFPIACSDSDAQTGAGNNAGSQNGGAAGRSSNAGNGGTIASWSGSGNPNSAGGTSSAGNAGVTATPVLPVELGTAKGYVILAESGISSVPTSAITGNVGLSPAAATFITGFSLSADATNVFSTASQVVGKLYAADYAAPTPANLTTAIGDMQLAFTDAAGRPAGTSELGAGNIGGMTLTPGVYKWTTALSIPTDVTLTGNATAVWIFQIAQNLTMSSGSKVVLAGGALSKNVFWQVSGLVELGTTAHCEGVVLTQTSVTLGTGASLNGRLFAQTAVNIDSSTVVEQAQ